MGNRSGLGAIDRRHIGAAALVMVFVAAAGAALNARSPWVDELMVIHFVDVPGDFISHNHGTGHPVGWYLPMLLAQNLGRSLGWLRAVGFLTLPAMVALICGAMVDDRRGWGRSLLLLSPAAVGTGAFIIYGTDLRPYGALALASVLVSVTLLHSLPETAREWWLFGAALTLLATTHLTGTVLSAWFAAITLIRTRPPVRRVTPVAILATVLVAISWWWGARDTSDAAGQWSVTMSEYWIWFMRGWSQVVVLAALLAAGWLVSLHQADRTSLLNFDIPALGTLFTLGVASMTVAPSAKHYTLVPAIVLLAAGLLRRVSSVPGLYMAVIAVLAVNLVTHIPGMQEEHHRWGASTAALMAHADEIKCPVWAWPDGALDVSTAPMLPGISVVPFGQDEGACECGDRWFIANHLVGPDYTPVLPQNAEILYDWNLAMVGRIPCSRASPAKAISWSSSDGLEQRSVTKPSSRRTK